MRENSNLLCQISFRRSWIQYFICSIASVFIKDWVRTFFLKVEIRDVGIVVYQLFKQPVTLPWIKVQCLDLSGLRENELALEILRANPLGRFFYRDGFKSRFFLVMSDEHELIRRCIGFKETWFAGKNVLGLTNITAESADNLFKILSVVAAKNKISLDTIVLGDF